ncbi:MAG: hypothetical protein QW041_00245 [Candidatus Pacearchaeota archaeon]
MTKIKKIKLKLLPSLKEEKHYLVFRGDKEKVVTALKEFLGILGIAKASPMIIETKKDIGILSFNRKYTNEIKTALIFYNIKTIGISGTLKKAKEKFIK